MPWKRYGKRCLGLGRNTFGADHSQRWKRDLAPIFPRWDGKRDITSSVGFEVPQKKKRVFFFRSACTNAPLMRSSKIWQGKLRCSIPGEKDIPEVSNLRCIKYEIIYLVLQRQGHKIIECHSVTTGWPGLEELVTESENGCTWGNQSYTLKLGKHEIWRF